MAGSLRKRRRRAVPRRAKRLQDIAKPLQDLSPAEQRGHQQLLCAYSLVDGCEDILEMQDFMPPPQPISFEYSPNRFMPVKLRAFLDFALPRLKARLGDPPKGIAPPRRGKSPVPSN